jgi:hypothetical protein
VTQAPPSPEPPAPQGSSPYPPGAPPPYDPRWLGPPPGPWWGGYAPPPRSQPADPRAISARVQVWAGIEVVLGALLIGTILLNQASWETWSPYNDFQGKTISAPPYMTAFAYLAGLLLAATLCLVVRGLFSRLDLRLGRFQSSQIAVAAAAAILAGGYLLTTQIATWTAGCPGNCPAPGPTANTVVSTVAIDVGAALAAALLPGALGLWCRTRADARPAPSQPPASAP